MDEVIRPATEAASATINMMIRSMDTIEFREGVGVPKNLSDNPADIFYEGVAHGLMLAKTLLDHMGPQHRFTMSDMEAVIEKIAESTSDNTR